MCKVACAAPGVGKKRQPRGLAHGLGWSKWSLLEDPSKGQKEHEVGEEALGRGAESVGSTCQCHSPVRQLALEHS